MPAEVIWLDQALDDLQSVSDYNAMENPSAAARYVNTVLSACAKLTEFPESGRRYGKRYRALVVRNHIVFYRYDRRSRTVTITTIIDGRRDISAILDEDQ
jgi:toxin ParE1/3/4